MHAHGTDGINDVKNVFENVIEKIVDDVEAATSNGGQEVAEVNEAAIIQAAEKLLEDEIKESLNQSLATGSQTGVDVVNLTGSEMNIGKYGAL